MKKFALATLLVNGNATPALLIEQRYFPFSAELRSRYRDLKAALEDWDRAFPAISQFAQTVGAGEVTPDSVAESEARLDTPIRFPNKVLATGGNYADHMKEAGFPVKRVEPLPIFSKPPTTCVVGPGRTLRRPKASQQFDWELELVIVIGRRTTAAGLEEAAEAIGGYTIGLDMSARDLLKLPPPLHADVFRCKCQDTMAPLGPLVVPSKFIADPCNLSLLLKVNGRTMQESNTSNMIVPPAEIVSLMSQSVTLEPGDVLFTGTPAGTGMGHNYFLQPGDVIDARIGELGALVVEVCE